MGIKDSRELAWQDWLGSAGFDRGIDDPAGADYWAYRWAQAYVDFAATEKRSWLHAMGVRWFPLVGWAERGGYLADGTATRSRASTSRGAPGPEWSHRLSGGSGRRWRQAGWNCCSGTGSIS